MYSLDHTLFQTFSPSPNKMYKQAFLQKMIKSKESTFERIVSSLPDLPYRSKVVADFGINLMIQIGPDIAVSIINGNEFALCCSIGDKDENFYNDRGEDKWHLFYIPEMGYKDVCYVSNVKEELIRLINYVHKNANLVSQKVKEAREELKKYLEK